MGIVVPVTKIGVMLVLVLRIAARRIRLEVVLGTMALLMTAIVVAAQPNNAQNWIGPEDYPRAALVENRGGQSGFRITISSEGKPLACEIYHSSGSADLDAQTCLLVMRRATFEPARDANGQPITSVYRNVNSWWTARMPPERDRGLSLDLELTVNRLPEGVDSPATATVAFAVDPSGAMADCTPTLPSPAGGDGSKRQQQHQLVLERLGKIACTQIMANYEAKAAVVEGVAVASVQTAKVRFVAAQAGR